MTDESIFAEALNIADVTDRLRFLDRVCAGNAKLRREVEQLLAAASMADDFLDKPAVPIEKTGDYTPGGKPTADFDPAAELGTIVAGRYKLLQVLGEGGMGSVYMAEQREPVKRMVAVKLIKTGMDSKQVLARFEAERQALALMDHPNIARIYDAGVTGQTHESQSMGVRPFFVMELVKGIPITQFCDERKLTPRERLELFIPVCQAVQHAHQKGIIHRDLKPSNVMVALYDGRPVPKVIDFGVAKAAGEKLTEKTMFTAFGAVVGTPQYMSPEQAELNQQDVDTRSDIYSLGVLLYELLTGQTPFTKLEMEKAGLLEVLRLIREVEPSRPSTKLSTANALASIAANRGTEPKRLMGLVKGEIDWIVMKALEKDRNRRYETANGLAMDIQRHLAGDAVLACPPSTGYKLRKFVQRNRPQVVAAAVVLLALLGGFIGTGWGMLRAERERMVAVAAREAETEQRVIAETKAKEVRDAALAESKAKDEALARSREAEEQRGKALSARKQARSALDALTDDVVKRLLSEKPTLGKEEKAFLQKIQGYYDEFTKEGEQSVEARLLRARGYGKVASIHVTLGNTAAAKPAFQAEAALLESLVEEFPRNGEYRNNLATVRGDLANILKNEGKVEEAIALSRRRIKDFAALHAEFPDNAVYRYNYAVGLLNFNLMFNARLALDEKESLCREAQTHLEIVTADPAAPRQARLYLSSCYNNLGTNATQRGNHAEAEEKLRKALAVRERLAADFPDDAESQVYLANILANIGGSQVSQRKWADADASWSRDIEIRGKLVERFPGVPAYRHDLARNAVRLGMLRNSTDRPEAAIPEFDRAITALAVAPPPGQYRAIFAQGTALARTEKAKALDRLKRHAEAVKEWDKVIETAPAADRQGLRAERATSRIQAGMVEEAVAEVADLTKTFEWNSARWYNFACVYSLASAKVPDRKAEYADCSMELLQKAVDKGWKDADHLAKDADFAPIKEREDFKKLLAGLQAKQPRKIETLPAPKDKE